MAATINILNDLGTYTKIPNKAFDLLASKEILCIGSAINEAILAHENEIALNIGIGTLGIELSSMTCKFVPSKELKNTIKLCTENKAFDPLEFELEESLKQKLLAICEETL